MMHGKLRTIFGASVFFLLASPAGQSSTPETSAHARAVPQNSIRTPAGLSRYLHTTPAEQSPLSLLPVGARKRFLGTLVWGSKGVASFSFADLQQYLTDGQILRVLTLFDLQSFAHGLHGRLEPLTAAERHARESPLEHKFDQLFFSHADRHDDNSAESIPELYDQLLAIYQVPQALTRLHDSDVGLLFRAAALGSSVSHQDRYLDDLSLDLATLHRRGLATAAQVADVHDQLVAARRLDAANSLAREYPSASIDPLPPLQTIGNVKDGEPTALTMEPDGKSMLRKPIDMQAPLRIVVVAGCHFSVDAVRAIRSDPELDKLFHEHAIWLADENESLQDVLQWNREFPDQRMHVAWRNREWHMLDSWGIPTFYVFRQGRLVEQWSGWPHDTGMQSLRAHLMEAGVLPPASA